MAQDITDKVAKLLAMAESTDHPSEAEAFTAKAEELMLAHGIEEAHLAARRPGSKGDPIIIERIRVSGQFRAALATYGAHVARPFSLKGYYSQVNEKENDIWLVGHTSDVGKAATLIRSLLIQSLDALKYWWYTEGRAKNPPVNTMNQYLAKRQFLFSFGVGVESRLEEVYGRVVEVSSPGTELVMLDRSKEVDSWVGANMNFGKARRSSMKGGTDNAVRAGYTAGRESVGTKHVTA